MTSAAMAARTEPPHSVVAEQAVLGSLLLDNSALPRATAHLTERDFYNHEHRALFSTMVQLIYAGQQADVITVFERIQAAGQVEGAGLLGHLNALAQSVPSASNVGQYAAKVREYAIVRDGMALGDELQAELKGALSQQIDPCTVLRRFAERLTDAVAQAPGAAFKLLTVADLQALPPQRWRIHSVLPAQGVAAVFGPSSTGKSFLVLDMTAAGCQGAEWFGYRVKPSKWLYVAMEGQAAFRHRVEAWEQSNDQAFPEGVRS